MAKVTVVLPPLMARFREQLRDRLVVKVDPAAAKAKKAATPKEK